VQRYCFFMTYANILAKKCKIIALYRHYFRQRYFDEVSFLPKKMRNMQFRQVHKELLLPVKHPNNIYINTPVGVYDGFRFRIYGF